jgi:hypothetical protein
MVDYGVIGSFIYENFVLPALDRGKPQVAIRVADVWRSLGTKHGMVAIHVVLSSNRFKETYFLDRVGPPSPPNSLPTEYTFDLHRLRSLTTPRRKSEPADPGSPAE